MKSFSQIKLFLSHSLFIIIYIFWIATSMASMTNSEGYKDLAFKSLLIYAFFLLLYFGKILKTKLVLFLICVGLYIVLGDIIRLFSYYIMEI